MANKILNKDEGLESLKAGIDAVANAVKVTLGPGGRNVIIEESYGSPTITKDGVTVAKKVDLPTEAEKVGASLAKEVASKTNDVAGDGTTSAVILFQAIIAAGKSSIESGAHPVAVRRGIEKAVEKAVEWLDNEAEKIEGDAKRLNEVASVSANDAEIGALIAEVFGEVGADGVVTVEESNTTGLSKEMVEGMQFDRGYISPYMMTDTDRMRAVMDDPYILVTDEKISSISDILPLLEKVVQAGKKDMVLIAEDVEGEALATLVVNKLRGTFNVLAVKAPGFGDRRKAMLEDIAVVTGATLISKDLGRKLESVDISELGKAHRVISDKDNTTIVDGGGSKKAVEERVSQIRNQVQNTDSEFDKEKLMERLGKLSGGVAVIKVGGVTETEVKELKYRIEDAKEATKAALEEGIVPGGGVALFEASKHLENHKDLEGSTKYGDEKLGIDIIVSALQQPMKLVAENAGKSGQDVFNQLESDKKGHGFNALTGEFGDMKEMGIVDPVKVVKSALQNSASIASLVLTSGALVYELKEEQKDIGMPTGMGGGMPGMGGMM